MSQKTIPLVSIITINFNNTEITCDLLASLRNISYPNTEIIVVDNGSTRGKASDIKKQFPEIRLIYNPKNLGFAGGNNTGTLFAKGKYLIYLNNDIAVSPDFLEPLVDLFENNPNAGMCSPKILFHRTKKVEYEGKTYINSLTTRNGKVKKYFEDNSGHNKPKETPLPHGAALMVSAKLVREINLMPDIYFLYYEEYDWAETFKRRGYKVYYVSRSTVYHKASYTVGHQSVLKTYFLTRGRVLYLRRNIKGGNRLISLLFITFVTLPIHVLLYLFRFQFNHLWAFLKGIAWHLGNFDIYKNPRLIVEEGGNLKITNSYYHND